MLVGHANVRQFDGGHAGRWRLATAKNYGIAPASHMQYFRPDRELGIVALGHGADCAACHRFAKRERIGIAFRIIHAAAHIGVDG